jgi:hypothetical protein
MPPPVYYPAADAAEVRRRFPPDVVAECTNVPCCCCLVELLAHAPVLSYITSEAGRAGRRLAIVCGTCADELVEGSRLEMRLIDPKLQARIDQWVAESN